MILLMQYLCVERQNLSIVLVYSLYNISAYSGQPGDLVRATTNNHRLLFHFLGQAKDERGRGGQTMGVWMQEKGHTTVEGIN